MLRRLARWKSRDRLGHHRWVMEHTLSWLNRKRRLKTRSKRYADVHLAFLALGCALICSNFIQEWFCLAL